MPPKKRKPQIKPNVERKPARKQPAKATVVQNQLAFENVLSKAKLLLKEHPYKHGPTGTPKVIRDKMGRFFLPKYIKKTQPYTRGIKPFCKVA